MLSHVLVSQYEIGYENPVYLIAEIGINHNGDLDTALRLISNAKFAGFNAVKFQKRTIDIVYSAEELAQPRTSTYGETNGDLKRGLEFGVDEYKQIDQHCKSIDIDWFASPWDLQSVDFLEEFNVPAHKVASACLTDADLLKKLRKTGKPIFLSTGMSTLEQIRKAVSLLDSGNLVLLHTVSTYPARDEMLNLSAIETLKREFPEVPIGYSGHEVGLLPSVVAVAKYGAVCIERHITLDRSMWGSDQAASIELEGMIRLVRDIRQIPRMLGTGEKVVIPDELPIQKKLRRVDNLFN